MVQSLTLFRGPGTLWLPTHFVTQNCADLKVLQDFGEVVINRHSRKGCWREPRKPMGLAVSMPASWSGEFAQCLLSPIEVKSTMGTLLEAFPL